MTIPTEIELMRQSIEKLAQRTDDLALAFAKMRAEVDANTEAVNDHHLWIMHGHRAPDPQPKPPFKP